MLRTSRLLDRSPRQVYQYINRRLRGLERLGAFSEEHPCVFVLSTGRVGTKTLAALLRLAPNLFVYHEPVPKLFGLSALAYRHFDDLPARKMLLVAFGETRGTLLNYSLACSRGYVETGPHVTFLAPTIVEAVPGVKFIHLVRDPRQVVRSAMRREWYDGHKYDRTRIMPRPNSDLSRRWSSFDAFQKSAWLWAETNRWIMEFASTLPDDRTMLVRAEDIFSQVTRTIDDLFEFVSAPLPSSRKIERVLAGRLNQQERGAFPRPTNWTDEMNEDLSRLAGEVAREIGYDIGA
jgi:hypothetical protein